MQQNIRAGFSDPRISGAVASKLRRAEHGAAREQVEYRNRQ
jgi:hypothetical protein